MNHILPCGCEEGKPHAETCRIPKVVQTDVAPTFKTEDFLDINIYGTVVGDIKDTNPKSSVGASKVPLDCVSPLCKAYASVAHFLGKVKYGAWNWRAGGARASTYYAAVNRHLDAWYSGEFYDSDGTPHLANALACINILIEAQYHSVLEDDRPPATDLKPIYADIEAMMKAIRDKYGERAPRHYTIKDNLP